MCHGLVYMIPEGQTLVPSKTHVKGMLVYTFFLNNILYYMKFSRHVNVANLAI